MSYILKIIQAGLPPKPGPYTANLTPQDQEILRTGISRYEEYLGRPGTPSEKEFYETGFFGACVLIGQIFKKDQSAPKEGEAPWN